MSTGSGFTTGRTSRPRLRSRGRNLVGEGLRYLAVGGLATLVSVIGFNALVHGVLVDVAPLRDDPIPAYVLANVVAGLVAYLGMRWWAFSHRNAADPVESVVRFFVLGAATMVIPVLCLAFSRYVLGQQSVVADNLSANVIGLGLSTITRFWVFRRYVFLAAAPVIETGTN